MVIFDFLNWIVSFFFSFNWNGQVIVVIAIIIITGALNVGNIKQINK